MSYVCICTCIALIYPPVRLKTNDFPVTVSTFQLIFNEWAPSKNDWGRKKYKISLGNLHVSKNKEKVRK